MPLFEAFVDETQVMRYKLVSLPKNTAKVPIIVISNQDFDFDGAGIQGNMNPSTKNGSNGTLGFTAIVHDSDVVDIGVAAGGSVDTTTGTIPTFLSDADERTTKTVVGRRFVITSKPVAQTTNTKITVVGNETGGTQVINVKVRPDDSVT